MYDDPDLPILIADVMADLEQTRQTRVQLQEVGLHSRLDTLYRRLVAPYDPAF